jgi:hypothetical protein
MNALRIRCLLILQDSSRDTSMKGVLGGISENMSLLVLGRSDCQHI